MIAADFNNIMTALDFRISECKKFFLGVKTTAELQNLTLLQASQLKEFCKEEEVIMTKIAMVDLYHIIGMGKLTPPQMTKFIFKIQEYLRYRPSIKVIAQHLESITDLPTLPVHTKFKLLALCDLTLTTGEEGLEEFADIEDYSKVKDPVKLTEQLTSLPFSIRGKEIRVPADRYAEFVDLVSKQLRINLSVNNLRQKVAGAKEYFGIQWQPSPEGAVGIFFSEENYKKLAVIYNSTFS